MRYAITFPLFLCLCVPLAFNQTASTHAPTGAQGDVDAIQAIEDALLKSESTTDIAVFERTLADDYVNLGPHGTGPGKEKIIEGMKPHAGQAPPYSVEMHNLQVYVLGDTAFAAFVKTYTAKFSDPATDSRTPDIIVAPNVGVVYTGHQAKVSEHGGFAYDDRNVIMIVSSPGFSPATYTGSVETRQVAPTVLQALGIDPSNLQAVQKEGTEVLPGLPFTK